MFDPTAGSLSAMFFRLPAILVLSITLLLTGCGGGGSASKPSTVKEWTWISGSRPVTGADSGQSGVYGAMGTASDNNVPAKPSRRCRLD